MARMRPSAWAGSTALLIYVLLFSILVGFSKYAAHQTILDLMSIGTALAAACLCGLAAKRAQDRFMVWYWGLFTLANAFSAVAEAVWAVYELGLGIEAPYPSFADAAWLLYYPLAFAGLMRLAKAQGRSRLSGVTPSLDAALFSVAGAGLSWEFLMVPVIDAEATSLANLTSLAYPIGDLLLLGALASLAVSASRRTLPRGTMWVVGSMVVMLVADVIFTRMTIAGTYATGAWVDPLWPLSYALLGVGALVYVDGRAQGRRVEAGPPRTALGRRFNTVAFMQQYSPYLAILVAAFLTYNHFVRVGGAGPVQDTIMVIIATLIPLIVLTRQLLVSAENRRLHDSLTEAAHVLEARVMERTQELATEKNRLDLLNLAAREISGCTSVRDILGTGARLIAQATLCETVAIAAPGHGGRSYFGVNRDLPETTRESLRRVLRRFMAVHAGTGDATPVRVQSCGDQKGEDRSQAEVSGPFAEDLIFPLLSRGTMLGAACLLFDPSNGGLSDEESALVQNVTAQIAVALQNARRYDEARSLADSDPLTGLANHRSATERLELEFVKSERAGSQFALIMMDVDDFKQTNDTHGHVVGDRVLVATANALTQALRAKDVLARLGGDEFLAILPATDEAGAVRVLERIRDCLASNPVAVDDGTIPLRVSCGVAVYPLHGRRPEALLSVADENMYRAKREAGSHAGTTGATDARLQISVGAFAVLDSLIRTVDSKDHYTRAHSDDVAKYAETIAGELGLPSTETRTLRISGLLHDVGKIGVSEQILCKPGPLTPEEYAAVKQHSDLGQLIIKEIPSLRDVRAAVANHHERFDGDGYPQGLKGDNIPLHGRILAVADAYAAITSDRPHRRAMSPEEARDELLKASGSQLDPSLVEALLAVLGRTADPAEMSITIAPAR